MRYTASEKLEIIRIVDQSHLPARRTLEQLGIPRRTFYHWYDRLSDGGSEALEDRPSAPSRVSTTNPGCSATMVPATSPANWPNISKRRA